MGFPFAAVAGAVIPELVGGILNRGKEKKARSRAESEHDRARWEFGKDRRNEREYAAKLTADSRAYARKQTADDRAYAKKLTASDRRYAELQTRKDRRYAAAITRNERKYSEKRTADDRAYLAKLTASDRKYAEGLAAKDRAAYAADVAKYQKVADRQAERSAASRRIDFEAMRDDAVKAGFNPLTAMQFANSYSRATDYQMVGMPGASGGTSIVPSQVAGSSMPGPSSVIPSTSIGSSFVGSQSGETFSAPATSYQAPGTGYAAATGAIMSSPSAFENILEAGISAYSQAKADEEAMYENIAGQVADSQMRRAVGRTIPYQNFGFDMTKVQPFQPSVAVGSPSLRTSSTPPEVWDGVHNRPFDVEPTPNTGVTQLYDVGGGQTVRGLSQGVEWSEIAQMGNEVWLLGSGAYKRLPSLAKPTAERSSARRSTPRPRTAAIQYPDGFTSYYRNGVLPVWNPLR